MSALQLHNVSKTRGARRHAVRALIDVSLAVEPGEFVLLQGPSGSGKTTLLAVAGGLLEPDWGDVRVEGRSLGGVDPAGRRRLRAARLGFVFQRSNLLPNLSARENVLVQAALAGFSPRESAQRTEELLEALGVASLGERRPGELSGGEEQRVAVARALVHRPALVLADEPTANLDGASGTAVAGELRALAVACGAAVLVATHDFRLEAHATRRVGILDGRLEQRGETACGIGSSKR